MRRTAFLLAAIAALSLPALAQVLVNGAGASFPFPIYARWFDTYHQLHPDSMINYQSVGSGAGIRQLQAGVLDLGATDMPLTDAGASLLHFPTVVGAVVPVYNLPKLTRDLDFTPQIFAAILLGQITRWNDPRLAELAHGVTLPAEDILVVHRSDASGTSYILSDYLSKTSPAWNTAMGRASSLRWRAGIGAKGNEGVAGFVKQTPWSIGYVELVYALQNRMTYGRVRNAAGRFIKADIAGIKAAAASSVKTMPADFRISITDADGKDAYPIASYTWLLAPQHIADPVKRRIITDFLRWMAVTGQQQTGDLGYAPLPAPIAARVLKSIDRIH